MLLLLGIPPKLISSLGSFLLGFQYIFRGFFFESQGYMGSAKLGGFKPLVFVDHSFLTNSGQACKERWGRINSVVFNC